jgi:hypothetical protein
MTPLSTVSILSKNAEESLLKVRQSVGKTDVDAHVAPISRFHN